MSTAVDKAPVQIAPESARFFPIPLDALLLNAVTRFDLYFQPGPDRPYVLYRRGDVAFTIQAKRRLQEHNVAVLFVKEDEVGAYGHYIERSLPSLLANGNIRLHDKAGILYAASEAVVSDVFQEPSSPERVRRGRGLVRQSVEFILGERRAFRHLIGMMPTGGYLPHHSTNVFTYATGLARRVGYTQRAVLRELSSGCYMMDAGMAAIEDDAEAVDGPLTDEQREKILAHPSIGCDLLDRSGSLGEIALDIVRHHHERLDGSGYPSGLKGEELSPFVRIAAICDVFDALTAARPHRGAHTTFEALRIMNQDMGSQLDAGLLRSFVEMMGNP